MSEVHILAIDLAKRSFQVCGADRGGAVLFNRTVSRSKLEQSLRGQSPCIVAMEACATSHYWGRMARASGHEVRLIPPIYVKPFVKRQKNDAADAAAIAEAAVRPNMHCVAVKSAEHQARAVAFRAHQCFVGQRTQLINALRGHLAEFGLVVAKGPTNLKSLATMMEDASIEVPEAVRDVAQLFLDQIETITRKIDDLALRLKNATRENEEARRLCTVPGVGPVTAGAVLAFAPDLRAFSTGRNFAAWLGLVPRQHSTGGKTSLGAVSKMGQNDFRRLLIVGAMSRIRWIVREGLLPDNWLGRTRPQTTNGRGRRSGQQNGARHLGDDDEGTELSNGVIRGNSIGAEAEER